MQNTSHTKQIGTVKELADYLRVSDRTVYNWVAIDLIPSIKIGRNRRFDFDDCLKALKEHGTETK